MRYSAHSLPNRRHGGLMMEAALSLTVLAIMIGVVTDFTLWTVQQKRRHETRLEAMETASNVLETARALPWDELTPEWAAQQKAPAQLSERWANVAFAITVQPEPDRPRVKRVAVEVKWVGENAPLIRPVTITAQFAARTVGGGS